MSAYDQDFHLWLQCQARLLREKRFEELDLNNLVEEVESFARAEVRAVRESVCAIIKHILLLRIVPDAKERWEWESEISHHRIKIESAIETSPSLKKKLAQLVNQKRLAAEKLAASRLATLGYPEDTSLQDYVLTYEDIFGPYADELIERPLSSGEVRTGLLDRYRDAIVASLVASLDPGRIIIFGSCAHHQDTESSDIDIAVITKPNQTLSLMDISRARSGLHKTLTKDGPAVDLIAIHVERFDLARHDTASIWHNIDQEGVVIYDVMGMPH